MFPGGKEVFLLIHPVHLVHCQEGTARHLKTSKTLIVNDIWNKSYMNCGNEMEMKKWSSQWTQFMQLSKEAWKKKKILDFNGVWTRDFHGDIWTHNRPASNVSGFIAQLVEHRTGIARSRVQPRWSPEFFSRFSTQLHKLPSLRRSFLHFQNSYLRQETNLRFWLRFRVPSHLPLP